MSEETVPLSAWAGQPMGLLQQMEELMAVLNANLSALDEDFQRAWGSSGRGSVRRRPSEKAQAGGPTGEAG